MSDDHTTADLLRIARTAARLAAGPLISHYRRSEMLITRRKTSAMDLVSEADAVSQRVIVRHILSARPGDGIIAEEALHQRESATGVSWIIDPLDGTANYLRGIPQWAVSIACQVDKEIVAGVVYDALRDEEFYAERGKGARLNDTTIEIRDPPPLDEMILALTIGPGGVRDADGRLNDVTGRLFARVGQVRSWFSLSLDLAWAALGRCDAVYHEGNAGLWDFAAGGFMCNEAGLKAMVLPPRHGGTSHRVLAAHPELYPALLATVETAAPIAK